MFPTLQKNDSPFSILPNYIDVLGRKIDNATTQEDWLNFDVLRSHGISIPSCNPTWTSNNGQERIASIKDNDRATQNFGRK